MRMAVIRCFAFIAAVFAVEGRPNAEGAEWTRLTSLPDPEGFAGPFAGVTHGALLVAGGANFPDKKPWDGGQKFWYDRVFVLESSNDQWQVAGKLPRPLAYGVSLTYGDSVICVGGSDANQHYADVYRLEWLNQRLVTTSLPSLPTPIANASGAMVGTVLYVGGGQERPDSTMTLASVWRLDLSKKDSYWQEVSPVPGGGRMLAVAAGFDDAFWLIGGVDLVVDQEGKLRRRYLSDACRFDPVQGWKRLPDLPSPVAASPSPAPSDASGLYILGADDGAQVGIEPQRHQGFSQRVLRFDIPSASWREHEPCPNPRVTVPCVRWNEQWVIPSGEVRPGVRSPEVWGFTQGLKD